MQVNVKLYGPFSLMSGRHEFTVNADEDVICVDDFLSLLARKIPHFSWSFNGTNTEQFLKQRILFVINGTPCSDKLKLIHDGDQIQILNPIAGG
jgi:molybdopterin converting factor small subunit